jgi:hypothetical protein
MKRMMLLLAFLTSSTLLFADEFINGITLPALKNYADQFIYLDKMREKICNFYELNPEQSIFINELSDINDEKRNLASVGFEILPLTPKQVFERNILILGKGNIINIIFLSELPNHIDIIQNNEMQIIEPYQGSTKKMIFEYSNSQLFIIKQIIADYLIKRNMHNYSIQQNIPAYSKKSLSNVAIKEIEFEDLTITLLGFSLGGPLANLMALNLNHYHPTMVDNKKIKIITFGSFLTFDADLAAFYDTRFKNVSLNLIHMNDPGLNFRQEDTTLHQVGTYILTPDPGNPCHSLLGYRQSLGGMNNDDYRIHEP